MDPRCKPRLTRSLDGRLVKSNLRWEREIVFYLRVMLTCGLPLNQTLHLSSGLRQLEAHFFDDGPNLNHDGREFIAQYFTTKNDINLVVLILHTTSALEFEAQITGIATLGVKDIMAWVRGRIFAGSAGYSITIGGHTYVRLTRNQLISSFSRTSSSRFQA